jgi:hypothetical protein
MDREDVRSLGQSIRLLRPLPILLLTVVLSHCGSPTSSNDLAIQFLAAPSVGGMFTLSLNGRTYTSPSLQTVVLSPGTYEVSGTATGTVNQGTQLIIGFSGGGTTLGKGGVESGSIVSVAGPFVTTSACGIGYYDGSPGPYQYRFFLTVTSDAAKAC